MNKRHCDLCDKVVIDYITSCPVTSSDGKIVVAKIKTAEIGADYCLSCWVKILKSLLERYESMK